MIQNVIQRDIASSHPLVKRLHKWRIQNGLGRTAAARELSAVLPVSISFRTLDHWEQGTREPQAAYAALLKEFLEKKGIK